MADSITISKLSGFGRGKDLTFDKSAILLGTDASADVRFDPAWDKTVSPRHATIEKRSDGWWMIDQSRDGCWIDGTRVQQTKIESGSVVELGQGGPRLKLEIVPKLATTAVRQASPEETPVQRERRVIASASTRSRRQGKRIPVGVWIGGSALAALLLAFLFFWQHKTPEQRLDEARREMQALERQVAEKKGGEHLSHLLERSAAVEAHLAAQKHTGDDVDELIRRVDALQQQIAEQQSFDTKFASVAKEVGSAVGLVVMTGNAVIQADDGSEQLRPFAFPTATAWAIGPNVFATNSHVSGPAKALIEGGVIEAGNKQIPVKDGAVFIVINQRPDSKLRVSRSVVHPKYGQKTISADKREPAVPPYDVGLLYVEQPVAKHMKVAPPQELEKLDSGYRIAYLGFPMEGLAGGGVNEANPVATMQSGILTSVTDYWLSRADFSTRLLLQHNLASAGGASGSPIFNANGEVVGILSAVNIIGQISLETGKPTRAPSAVLVNFAQRIDVLKDIYPKLGQ